MNRFRAIMQWLDRGANAWIEWAIDHPRTILCIAAAITAVLVGFMPLLRVDVDFSNYLNRRDPAVIALTEANDRFGSQLRVIVSMENPEGVFNLETLTLAEELETAFEALPLVEDLAGPLNSNVIRGTQSAIEIRSAAPGGYAPSTSEEIAAYRELVMNDASLLDYVVSSTGNALAFVIQPTEGIEMVPFAQSIEDVVLEYTREGIRYTIAGVPYVNLTLQRSMRKDLQRFLPMVIAVIVGILYLSFRWRWGVIIPFAVVALSVAWTLGMMAITGVPITVLSFILPVLLMAIGIADGIHVLSRYREALERTSEKREAILDTMLSMKRPVVMTSLTTAVGFLSLLNAYMVPQRTFGLFTALGILFAMLLSLLLIPAILRLVNAPAPRKRRVKPILSPVLTAIVRTAARYRWIVLAVAILLTGVFAAGIPLLEIETTQRAFLGEGHPTVQSMDHLDTLFAGSNQVMIEIDTGRADGLKDPEMLSKIVALEYFLEAQGVRKVLSIADVVREMNQRFHADDPAYYVIPEERSTVAQLLLLFSFQGGSFGVLSLGNYSAGEVMGFHSLQTAEEQRQLVREVGAYLDEHFGDLPTARMAGPTQIQANMFSSMAKSQLTSLGTSILAAGIIVILLMQSISAGVVSLVPLLFTVLFNFGVMAYAGKSLDIATLMISSITIGIGIDYGIHFIERYREERANGVARELSLETAARTTGTGIVFNALALALGFGVMLVSEFHGLQNFGLLIAMTMVVSALSSFVVIPGLLSRKAKAK